MGDSLITIIAIFLAAVLMFVFPLMSISERNDDVSQLAVETAIVEYVDNVRTTGKITQDEYDKLIQRLAATGNTYDVDMEVKIKDINPGKKVSQETRDKIGENVYYSLYTSQIMDELQEKDGVKKLKEGDIISATAKNTNTTISQMLKNFFYSMSGNNTYQIVAQHAGVVMTTAQK